MTSFFEKLKKGMDIDNQENAENSFETEEERTAAAKSIDRKTSFKESKKSQTKKSEPDFIKKMKKTPKTTKAVLAPEIAAEEISIEAKKEPAESMAAANDVSSQKATWPEAEGELVIDVYQMERELIVQSAVAGVKPEDLDISVEKDILTIKGNREKAVNEKRDYFFQECYWGPFSRKIILPVEVDPGRVAAEMREGVLTIILPKILKEKKMKVSVKEL